MRWIAGIDGGGSKTAVLLRTVDGKETRTCRVGSIDPAEYGVEGYAAGLLAALTQLGVTAERVAAVCIGIPCFGEYPELDAAVSARTRQLFPNGAVRCENDCYVGFAGAFGLKAGKPVRIANESLNAVGSLQVLTVPLPVLILVVLIAVFGILLAKTEFGRNVYLVGGNPEAARLAGINVNKIKVQLFMISGAIAALGGVILAARMNSGQPGAAANVDTDAITAVVLGGIAMTGGTGTMFGTFLGLLVLLTLNNGLLVLGVTTYWQNVAKGVVLVFALALDFYRTKRRNKVKEPPHN